MRPVLLESILPHHALDGLVGLAVVFSVLFLIVFDHDLAIHGEVDQLSDGHAFIDLYRLFDRDFQGPVAAEAYISFTGGRMDIDTQPAGGGFPFQEGDMGVCFGIFLGDAEVKICG
jgi:hypothetical protein